jgi:hypothetical protein
MSRWVVLLNSEYDVPLPLIEGARLELKGVEKDMPSTAAPRFIFSGFEELPSDTVMPTRLSHPEEIHVQPLPASFANQTANDLILLSCRKD